MSEPGPFQGLFEIEPSVSFRNVERSDALDRRIVKGSLITLRVSVDRSRQGRHSGDLYTIRFDLSNVKTHEGQTRGRVTRLPPEGGYGFVQGKDGRGPRNPSYHPAA